jgi:hypothetical protein
VATWNVYVGAEPVAAAFFTTSVSGCSAYLKAWPSFGEVGLGAVRDTPDSLSVTTLSASTSELAVEVPPPDVPDVPAEPDGLDGLLHATLAAMSTAVLTTMAVFFM